MVPVVKRYVGDIEWWGRLARRLTIRRSPFLAVVVCAVLVSAHWPLTNVGSAPYTEDVGARAAQRGPTGDESDLQAPNANRSYVRFGSQPTRALHAKESMPARTEIGQFSEVASSAAALGIQPVAAGFIVHLLDQFGSPNGRMAWDGTGMRMALGIRFVGVPESGPLASRQEGDRTSDVENGQGLLAPERSEGFLFHHPWPGIDVHLQAMTFSYKTTYVIQQPSQLEWLQLAYDGFQGVRIDDDGSLLLEGDGILARESAPKCWASDQSELECSYRLISHNVIGFDVLVRGDQWPLTIDPIFYATYVGGNRSDSVLSVGLQRDGSYLLGGYTNSPQMAGVDTGAMVSPPRAFVAGLSIGHRTLDFLAFLGNGTVTGLVTDPTGDIVVTGTSAGGLPVTGSAIQGSLVSGPEDAFVARMDSTGHLEFATYVGGSGVDEAYALSIGPNGSIIVVGSTNSLDFPTFAGSFGRGCKSDRCGFFVELAPDGAELLASSTFEGGVPRSVAVDLEGNSYVVGETIDASFVVQGDSFGKAPNLAPSDDSDAFLMIIPPGSRELELAARIGGSGSDSANAVGLDVASNVYLAGGTCSRDFPGLGPVYGSTSNESCAPFVQKITTAPPSMAYSILLGGDAPVAGIASRTLYDAARTIEVLGNGAVCVGGGITSPAFPQIGEPTVKPLNLGVRDDTSDGFVLCVDDEGTGVTYSTLLGGSDYDFVASLRSNEEGNLVVGLYTVSRDVPMVDSSLDQTYNGGYERTDRIDIALIELVLPGNGQVPVSIRTDPPGLPVLVDGFRLVAPRTFWWAPGSRHAIGADLTDSSWQKAYSFEGWNGTSEETVIWIVDRPATFTARFRPREGPGITLTIVRISTDSPDRAQVFQVAIGSINGYSGPDLTIHAMSTDGMLEFAGECMSRPIEVDGICTLTVIPSSGAPTGLYALRVTATNGEVSSTAQVTTFFAGSPTVVQEDIPLGFAILLALLVMVAGLGILGRGRTQGRR